MSLLLFFAGDGRVLPQLGHVAPKRIVGREGTRGRNERSRGIVGLDVGLDGLRCVLLERVCKDLRIEVDRFLAGHEKQVTTGPEGPRLATPLAQILPGVHPPAVAEDLVVQVGTGRSPGGADAPQELSASQALTGTNEDLAQVRVAGHVAEAVGDVLELFPVLFAIPRTVGWLAQWQEMLTDPEQKIARPRQVYVGEDPRDFVAIGERG